MLQISVIRWMRGAIRYMLRFVKTTLIANIVFLAGRTYVCRRFSKYARIIGAEQVLRYLGAQVGDRCRIAWDIRIQNAPAGSCERLRIGDHVYIGPECLIDLAKPVVIDDEVAISARVTIVTHADVGDRPLKEAMARREGAVEIFKGAWIGVNATILHGVTIGACSVVGAMSLVREDVPAGAVVVGIPASFLKWVKETDKTCNSDEQETPEKDSR